MNWTVFFYLVMMVESGCDPSAVGDLHLRNKAYGAAQIRLPYLKDVNRLYRKEVLQAYGRLLTERDMKSPAKARWVMRRYVGYWGARYSEEIKLPISYEVAAKIHHGGPDGWRGMSPSTNRYWNERFEPVLKAYDKQRRVR